MYGYEENHKMLEIFVSSKHIFQPGSSVSIVSGYGLDDRAIKIQSPAEVKGFFNVSHRLLKTSASYFRETSFKSAPGYHLS
jgi:hypothetical protein